MEHFLNCPTSSNLFRLFCDICDEFDLHDTEDCPTQVCLYDSIQVFLLHILLSQAASVVVEEERSHTKKKSQRGVVSD